jgi:hypothetical protein
MSRPGLLLLIALAGFALLAGDASAQCSMCRTALEQNSEVAAGFNRAILFLLAMPYAVFASGAGYVLFSRRKRRAKAAAAITREVRAPVLRGEDPISATS